MIQSPSALGPRRSCLFLAVAAALVLAGCATTPPAAVTTFKQGLSTVQTDSQTMFLELNRFARDLQVERAATLPNLRESDVAPALDAPSMARWNMAIEALALYASSLETLAAPTGAEKFEASLTALGDRITALTPPKNPADSKSDELNKAVGHLGRLIVDAASKKKALDIAREADPSIRAVLLKMADMVGADHMAGGLRSTMWSNWTVHADAKRTSFLQAGSDKRKLAGDYATAIEGRQTSDTALSNLRSALFDLADVHTAVAQGRSADASEIITSLRQEVAYAKQLLESARASKGKGETP